MAACKAWQCTWTDHQEMGHGQSVPRYKLPTSSGNHDFLLAAGALADDSSRDAADVLTYLLAEPFQLEYRQAAPTGQAGPFPAAFKPSKGAIDAINIACQ